MRPWPVLILVVAAAVLFFSPVTAVSEHERLPGVPDTVPYGPVTAVDTNYLQLEVLNIAPGVYTSKILHSGEDWEKEADMAERKFQDTGSTLPVSVAILANSQAIRKYQEGPYTSGEKDTALSRCYLRSAYLYSQSPVDENRQFAEDMYDRSLAYNRFNFDAWDGKIKLLESQGSFVAAQEARDQKQQAIDDQVRLAHDAIWLPLPLCLPLIALCCAVLLISGIRKSRVKK
jgi:hypothetical protein